MKKERNLTFTILSALGMTLVMLGHLDYGILTIGGLFPYYSFHVLIFVFVSGYFYKPEVEESIVRYFLHKAKTLLLPYFIWNLVYGIIATILHGFGFVIGGSISLYNLFVAPFHGGHQFMYNATAWFVPALFLLEMCNIIGRRILRFLRLRNEWVIAILYLMVGCFAVFMAMRGSVYDLYKIPGRLMVMAPAFALGRLYKEKLEKFDVVPTIILIPFLLGINAILGATHNGLAYSVVWVTGFANTPITPFITMTTGIWLWLRIASLISRLVSIKPKALFCRAISYYGNNTYSVMLHHLFVFMMIKSIFAIFSAKGLAFLDFDLELFHSDVYYTYIPGGIAAFKLVYLLCGVVISLAISKAIQSVKGRLYEHKD